MSERIIVALSGGVDSAVAALALRRAGHDLAALHMTNWDEDEAGYCTAADDLQDARRVARELGIVLHHVSFAAEYRDRVFREFLEDYAAGLTPNPDILCNREVKFGACLQYMRRLGGEVLATGHYARTDLHEGRHRLLRARDRAKDQSYFLQQIPRAALPHVRFPLGELTKSEVRDIAREAGLPVHDRPDSTGICFIGERPFREFLGTYLKPAPGPIETPEGEVLGEHQGLMHHTIGQRQGLGIGGRRSHADAPWYVAAKDVSRNALIVVQGHDHPLLLTHAINTCPIVWLCPGLPASLDCRVQIRHRQAAVPARVTQDAHGASIELSGPIRGVAPGQHAAFYDGDELLGGAVITASSPGTHAAPP
jgi:tRNA-specific 2-thiouridylase